MLYMHGLHINNVDSTYSQKHNSHNIIIRILSSFEAAQFMWRLPPSHKLSMAMALLLLIGIIGSTALLHLSLHVKLQSKHQSVSNAMDDHLGLQPTPCIFSSEMLELGQPKILKRRNQDHLGVRSLGDRRDRFLLIPRISSLNTYVFR